MNIKIWKPQRDQIIELWNAGCSDQEIKDALKNTWGVEISTRQVRRIGEEYGEWPKRWAGRVERKRLREQVK